jgi:Ser/Thr protein kinase RdoA (MazF antagonist)
VSCFSKGYVYEKAIENAKAMLKGYMREYPITKWELESGFHAHACLGTFVPWMEERYYNKNKKDAIDFIEHERELVKLCIEGKILNDLMV